MSGTISTPGYADDNLVPGAYFTIDASQANTGEVVKRALLIGQKTAAGAAAANTPILSSGIGAAQAACGSGSILARMLATFRQVDDFTEVWLLPLADDNAAVAATGTLAFTGPATAAGVLSAYVAGDLVPVQVGAGMTAAQIAAATAAAINAAPDVVVVASVPGGSPASVVLTAVNAGALGNDIDVRLNYQGVAGGEATPAGIGVAITPMAGGAQNPTALASALANLASQPFDYIAHAFTDTTSLNVFQSFLNDQTGRWSWSQEVFGHTLFAYRGSIGQRTTFFSGRNDPHASGIGIFGTPSPTWSWAAALAGATSLSVAEDEALPVTNIVLPVLAPPIGSEDSLSTRQTMLVDGCSTYKVGAGRQVVLERVVTTKTSDPLTGAPDNSFRDIETAFTLMAVVRDFRAFAQLAFARKKLVADGTPIAGGSNMVTSQTILAAFKARYRTLALDRGLVQSPELFSARARAVNAGGGVVKLFLPVMIANQLRIIVGNVQFTKP